ncbi:MAG: N-acetylmuramoyl-L-alanine amidase [Prevotella sp.]|jgi:N-acetylmuramoyl-L-alanine amidase|nr:N-acetylmuramoyl-L-alanine amidase [Prevotella sp.]MCH3994420.1 N-acetylmuramoyl-L-alanine amidase [Prevotella sp.]
MKRHFLIIFLALLSSVITVPVVFAGSAKNQRFTLVIDAGHGGHDAGALGAMSNEKDINLKVALAFGRDVERNCPDVRVIYTRKTDVFVPLMERANIANRNNADLFISIHTNALPAGRIAQGFETWTLGMHRAKDNLAVAMRENSVISMEKDYKVTYQGFDPNSSESYIMFEFIQDRNMAKSVDLAGMIEKNVCNRANRINKGVHQAGFLVLRETSMPSCLIELGFITTPSEEQDLNDASKEEAIADGIYHAFLEYKNKYGRRITVPYRSETKDTPDVPQIVSDNDQDDQEATKVNSQDNTHWVLVPPANKKTPVAQSTDQSAGDSDAKTNSIAKKRSQGSVPVKSKLADSKKTTASQATQAPSADVPVFKVQLFASSREVHVGDASLKGLDDFDFYRDGQFLKYTTGSSADYNEISRLRKSLLDRFPDAFIIAFKNGKRIDVNQAITEFSNNKKK